jgi:hypothetical protein
LREKYCARSGAEQKHSTLPSVFTDLLPAFNFIFVARMIRLPRQQQRRQQPGTGAWASFHMLTRNIGFRSPIYLFQQFWCHWVLPAKEKGVYVFNSILYSCCHFFCFVSVSELEKLETSRADRQCYSIMLPQK